MWRNTSISRWHLQRNSTIYNSKRGIKWLIKIHDYGTVIYGIEICGDFSLVAFKLHPFVSWTMYSFYDGWRMNKIKRQTNRLRCIRACRSTEVPFCSDEVMNKTAHVSIVTKITESHFHLMPCIKRMCFICIVNMPCSVLAHITIPLRCTSSDSLSLSLPFIIIDIYGYFAVLYIYIYSSTGRIFQSNGQLKTTNPEWIEKEEFLFGYFVFLCRLIFLYVHLCS